MAGMEQLEIHSKSYIVRWVKVNEGNTISWSVQPHKKSINFGIVKHPGTPSNGSSTLAVNDENQAPSPSRSGLEPKPPVRRLSTLQGSERNDTQSTAQEQLKKKGFILKEWHGKCDADQVSLGTYAVPLGLGGMYGLVFDNTFSKTVSKTATFVLLTYPSNAPPNAIHQTNLKPNAMSSALSMQGKSQSPRLKPVGPSESVDSLHSLPIGRTSSRTTNASGAADVNGSLDGNYHVGVLQKRRRKRGQGYARRYFSLDFISCTLSYYYNRNSSALRGAIPLSLAAIAADERRREFSIDSGAEIWHLKASNLKDFEGWTKALERASSAARGATDGAPGAVKPSRLQIKTTGVDMFNVRSDPEEDREWEQLEALVSRIVGTRDAVRRLTKDTRVTPLLPASTGGSPIPEEGDDYFTQPVQEVQERRPFWKRKTSSTATKITSPGNNNLTIPGCTNIALSRGRANSRNRATTSHHRSSQEEHGIHEHCAALLTDLDSVLGEFSTLIANSKRRRMPAPLSARSRRSVDSTATDMFFDAEAGDAQESSQIVHIGRVSSEESPSSERDELVSDHSSIASSSPGDSIAQAAVTGSASLFPPKPKSLSPLPLTGTVKRRKTVRPTKVMPPSLIAFLRKNVGKDFSTISMPVSSNEPTSLLQRLAENLEYSNLLDLASQHKEQNSRLLYVTAFAISTFTNGRAKERAIRKPFNPMLGETFELVRGADEGNYRFVAEKICHRPVRLACQADSPNWSFQHSPLPTQKFWGKSAELQTEGRVRVVLRLQDGTDECYSWAMATVFLRNVVMGEKYVEPTGSMNVINETTGTKATVEFKTKGMFGGRSEDVGVETYDEHGTHTGICLTGTWTNSLRIVEAGKGAGAEIWKSGRLVEGSIDRYGFTEFAASLNEISETDKGMAMTDSRLRRDQRAAEDGDLDRAEELKKTIEDEQRVRRTKMEAEGKEWEPRWFSRVDDCVDTGEEVWRLKGGRDGYWEERQKGTWSGVVDVLGIGNVRN